MADATIFLWNCNILTSSFLSRSQGALMLFYTARIALLKGNFTYVSAANVSAAGWSQLMLLLQHKKTGNSWVCVSSQAQEKFLACIAAQQEWRQIHHLCYWELMWAYSFELNWREAYRYSDLLCEHSKWSQVPNRTFSPLARLQNNFLKPIMTSFLLLSCRLFMYIRKPPSWACCQRKKWQRWEKMWGNYSGVSERMISWSHNVECKFCHRFIVNCETCDLQAGGWPQTEDCWEIDSNREVCCKKGPAILFF